jgi:nifR3 family TIM-barrel protein
VNVLPKDTQGCPYLLLAPMEGIGDRSFRKAMAAIGGFDEAVTEFLRVPCNAHVASLARQYVTAELGNLPLAAQLMGSDPTLMAAMAVEVEKRGAPRIDINCGCPSNTVTGKGAGSSLLKNPELLHQVARAIVQAVDVPVSIKMRSGYEDTGLIRENLLAAQESGICYITLHPRTKVDGYGPPAKWEFIALAKSILKIPVVGNGDILNVADACRMLRETGCDALMVGRGSIINPFIFKQIRAYFHGVTYQPQREELERYFDAFCSEIPNEMPLRNRLNKLKQLFSFLFKGSTELLEQRQHMLTTRFTDIESFVEYAKSTIYTSYGF